MPRTSQGKYVTESSKIFQEGDDNWRMGKYDEARISYEKAAALYHKSNDIEGEAFVLSRLGELQLSLDNFDEAEKALISAVELVKDFEDGQNTYGEALIKLSKVQLARSEPVEALTTIMAAEKVLSGIGNRDLLGDAYEHEAYIYLMSDKEKKALEAYRKAAALYEQDNNSLKEAAALRAVARIEMKNKNYDEAHDLLERCRGLYRENGDLLGEASVLSAIGCLRYVIRDIPNARKALMKSVYLYGKAAHNSAEAESLLYLARVEASDEEQGDYDRAVLHYKRSIDLFNFLGNDTMKDAVSEEYNNFLTRTKCN